MTERRITDTWLSDGWSTPRILWTVISSAFLVAALATFIVARIRSHSGTWWLSGVFFAVSLFLGEEALRWRIRDGSARQELKRLAPFEDELRLAQETVARLSAEPLSDAHTADLKKTLRVLQDCVGRKQLCFDDGIADKNAVLEHFPELRDPLGEWDRAIGAVYERAEILRNKVDREAEQAGLLNSPYHDPQLRQVIFSSLIRLLDAPTLPRLDVRGYSNWLQIGDTRVATFPDYEGREGPLGQMKAAADKIDKFWESAESWSESEAYKRRNEESGWPELQPGLFEQIEALIDRDHFKRNRTCVRCE